MLFQNKDSITVRALYLGQRINLKAFENTQRLATGPHVIGAGADGAAVLFRYGVVVLFGLTAVEELSFLKDLESFVTEPFTSHELEEALISLNAEPGDEISGGAIRVQECNLPRIQLVAGALARSVILSHYETAVARTFDRIEPLATSLQHGGHFMQRGRELLEHIGDVLLIQGKMVGRVEIGEKPELLWDAPEYERFYSRLADEYELVERQRALERKLELVSRTAETVLELLQSKRSLRVEWYIVILIVVEIMLTVYEMWGMHSGA